MRTGVIFVLSVLLLANFVLSNYKILVVMENLWEGDVEKYLTEFPQNLGPDTEVHLMSDNLRLPSPYHENSFISLDHTKTIKIKERHVTYLKLKQFSIIFTVSFHFWQFPRLD